MKKNIRIIIIILSFAVLILLVISGYDTKNKKRGEFKALGETIAGYAETTPERVARAVITIPDTSLLVGLKDNTGRYETNEGVNQGRITIESALLENTFIPGIYEKRNPRLDATVPMRISSDSYGGSTYIVLFTDRGDAALEKSHARLGGLNTKIGTIGFIAASGDIQNEDYKVSVVYESNGLQKEVIIPVIDGHFDPEHTVSK